MPRYDFECPGCNHVFEAWDTMSGEKPTPCPECDAKVTKRLPSFGCYIHPHEQADWYEENGGKGRYCPQAVKGMGGKDKAYFRHREDLAEFGHRMGYHVEKD